MLDAKLCLKTTKESGRLIKPLTCQGPENMATDVMLLEKSLKEGSSTPTLRFYKWAGTWLSIGRNQSQWPENWNLLAKQGKLRVVRRPSGGGAVLHQGGLTYALIWPNPPRSRHHAYLQACQSLVNGFAELGLPLKFGNQSPNVSNKSCFESATRADLVDEYGYKRIGSAQRWKKGHLLQHGEIILDPPQQLWRDVFKSEAPQPMPQWIPRKGLENLLENAFVSNWSKLRWQSIELTSDELKEVNRTASNYSISLESLGSSTNPDETIDSTT